MDSYKLFKISSGAINLDELIAESIVIYCLCNMDNSNRTFQQWSIGISDDTNIECNKFWECSSEIIALDTKQYFVKQKIMRELNHNSGRYIYLIKN